MRKSSERATIILVLGTLAYFFYMGWIAGQMTAYDAAQSQKVEVHP